ncbi:MAG: hypothetical protein AB7U20_24030 [Planctomycetaceae bacterium]
MSSVDLIEELRLRRLAREAYVPPTDRAGLHPIILDELSRMDAEGMTPLIYPDDDTVLTDEPELLAEVGTAAPSSLFGSRIVPLMPDVPGWHGPHEVVPPHVVVAASVDSRELHYT